MSDNDVLQKMPAWLREGQQFWDSFPPTQADLKALESRMSKRLERIEAAIAKPSQTTEAKP